jgi:hypothetical protein
MDYYRHNQAVKESTHTQDLLRMLLPERVTAKLKAAGSAGFVCKTCGQQNTESKLDIEKKKENKALILT